MSRLSNGLTDIQQGQYILGKPVQGDLRAWSRWDLYLPTGSREHIRILKSTDTSPLYRHWQDGNYNPNCPCCYLGHGHSENYHNQWKKES